MDVPAVVDLSMEEESQIQPTPSTSFAAATHQQSQPSNTNKSGTVLHIFTIFQIIENIFIIGINSLDGYKQLLTRMISSSDPAVLQLAFVLKHLVNAFENYVLSEDESQDKLCYNSLTDRTFDELIKIFNPVLKQEYYLKKRFTIKPVEFIMDQAKTIISGFTMSDAGSDKEDLASDEEEELDFSPVLRKKQKLEFSLDDKFSKIFSKSKNKPAIISQSLQYVKNDTRFRVSTPGEKGTHLVKIEITDTNDLVGIGDKDHWRKVSKKGIFLLDTKINKSDVEKLKNLVSVLAEAGDKMSKIENSKFESWQSDNKKNK